MPSPMPLDPPVMKATVDVPTESVVVGRVCAGDLEMPFNDQGRIDLSDENMVLWAPLDKWCRRCNKEPAL